VEYSEDDRWLVVHRGPLRVVASLGGPARIPLDGEDGTAADGVGILLASRPGIAVDSGALNVPPATFGVIDSTKLRQIAELTSP